MLAMLPGSAAGGPSSAAGLPVWSTCVREGEREFRATARPLPAASVGVLGVVKRLASAIGSSSCVVTEGMHLCGGHTATLRAATLGKLRDAPIEVGVIPCEPCTGVDG